jgi:hypothetical protein
MLTIEWPEADDLAQKIRECPEMSARVRQAPSSSRSMIRHARTVGEGE